MSWVLHQRDASSEIPFRLLLLGSERWKRRMGFSRRCKASPGSVDWPQGEIASRLVRRFGGEVPLFRRPTGRYGIRVWARFSGPLSTGASEGLAPERHGSSESRSVADASRTRR